jgi:hypothetical protein
LSSSQKLKRSGIFFGITYNLSEPE